MENFRGALVLAVSFSDVVSQVIVCAIAVSGYAFLLLPQKGTRTASTDRSAVYSWLVFLAFSFPWVIFTARFGQTAWDFPEFFIAAHLRLSSLYSHADFVKFGEKWLAPLGIHYYPPFVRPAVFALAWKPLALFSFWHAYWVWAAVDFVAYAGALWILFRWLELPHGLLPAFALFMPGMFGIVTGQDANVFLFVLVCGVLLVTQEKELAGGCLFALCAYKFNLIVFLPVVLLAKARWKTLWSFGIGTALAAIASAALVSPSSYLAMLRTIPANTIGFIPGGIRGVSILAGHAGWYYPLAFCGAALCVYLITKLPLLEAFCVAVTGALLLTYHVAWYDCALLVLPITVAWRGANNATKIALLAIVLFPVTWFFRTQVFEVIVEILLLLQFAAMARRQSGSRIEEPFGRETAVPSSALPD